MKLWMLGSGSNGNAALVECGESRVLVDAGFGPRTLASRLRRIGVSPDSIEGCILTHDHLDHAGGAAAAARRWGWDLYATAGTAIGADLPEDQVTVFAPGARLRFTRLDVDTARIPHDASEPIGLVVTEHGSGARAGICYDVGHANASVRKLCRDVDVLVLEANHDEGLLWAGPYPPWLRARIASATGHLSNRAAADLARESASKQLAHLVLAHLSEANNSPSMALGTVRRGLRGTTFRGKLSFATQEGVHGPITPKGSKTDSADQYSMF